MNPTHPNHAIIDFPGRRRVEASTGLDGARRYYYDAGLLAWASPGHVQALGPDGCDRWMVGWFISHERETRQ